jgi:hypothetical protein
LHITGASENGQARILVKARISEGELTEKEDGTAGGLDAAGVKAITAQSGVDAA